MINGKLSNAILPDRLSTMVDEQRHYLNRFNRNFDHVTAGSIAVMSSKPESIRCRIISSSSGSSVRTPRMAISP
jgi:hypothetical protein